MVFRLEMKKGWESFKELGFDDDVVLYINTCKSKRKQNEAKQVTWRSPPNKAVSIPQKCGTEPHHPLILHFSMLVVITPLIHMRKREKEHGLVIVYYHSESGPETESKDSKNQCSSGWQCQGVNLLDMLTAVAHPSFILYLSPSVEASKTNKQTQITKNTHIHIYINFFHQSQLVKFCSWNGMVYCIQFKRSILYNN